MSLVLQVEQSTDCKSAPAGGWHKLWGMENINNINNIIKLHSGAGSILAKISAHYLSKQFFTNGLTVRQWLSSQSFNEQYEYGIKMLNNLEVYYEKNTKLKSSINYI